MKNFNTLLLFFLALIMGSLTMELQAQNTPLPTAIEGIQLRASQGGTNNRSGMVFNPAARLYYAVNAGATDYPADTYDEAGV